MDKYYQIAMDGPAGAGKSTLAKRLARELGFTFINSGGMYRCFAIAIRDNGSDYSNIPEVIKAIKGADVSQIGTKMLLNNIDVTQKCYTPEITLLVPEISKIKEVRDECHDAQLRLATGTNIVIEGRDTTTVMFPDATLKVFVTASSELRAQRRWEQIGKKGTYEEVLADLIKRDLADTTRVNSPLRQAPDAFVLDTTNLTEDKAIEILLAQFNKRI